MLPARVVTPSASLLMRDRKPLMPPCCSSDPARPGTTGSKGDTGGFWVSGWAGLAAGSCVGAGVGGCCARALDASPRQQAVAAQMQVSFMRFIPGPGLCKPPAVTKNNGRDIKSLRQSRPQVQRFEQRHLSDTL